MSEFRSKLEGLLEAVELDFDPTPAFGEYKNFLESAISHPAKMNTALLGFLVQNFTKLNEVVLDPMAGSGSLGVVAALHGRNAVQVELEPKFYGWMEEARLKVEKHSSLTEKGEIRNILGDARQLSNLLAEADTVITSPPYSDSPMGGGLNTKPPKNPNQQSGRNPNSPSQIGAGQYSENPENIGNLKHGNIDAVITSPPYSGSVTGGNNAERREERIREAGLDPKNYISGEARNLEQDWKYGESKGQIGNLKHGEIAAIITSPPYGNRLADAEVKDGDPQRMSYALSGAKEGENIGRLPLKVDTVITSPPYAEVSHHSDNPKELEYLRPGRKARVAGTAGINKNNIGYLPFVDTVITSPPYEASLEGSTRHTKGGIASRDPKMAQSGTYATTMSFGVPVGYSPDKENIGNLKKESYLEAMLQVYGEMHKVLKPQGLAIIVIKPFIRNKQVVDLPYHTWLLLQQVGFKLEKLFKLRLKNESFWRILYSKKYPEVEKIAHEYVIAVRKT